MRAAMLVAQSSNPPSFPQPAGLPANLASTEGLLHGGSDAFANRFIPTTVYVKPQPAEFFFNLQDFKFQSGCPLEFGDQRFQVLA